MRAINENSNETPSRAHAPWKEHVSDPGERASPLSNRGYPAALAIRMPKFRLWLLKYSV